MLRFPSLNRPPSLNAGWRARAVCSRPGRSSCPARPFCDALLVFPVRVIRRRPDNDGRKKRFRRSTKGLSFSVRSVVSLDQVEETRRGGWPGWIHAGGGMGRARYPDGPDTALRLRICPMTLLRGVSHHGPGSCSCLMVRFIHSPDCRSTATSPVSRLHFVWFRRIYRWKNAV